LGVDHAGRRLSLTSLAASVTATPSVTPSSSSPTPSIGPFEFDDETKALLVYYKHRSTPKFVWQMLALLLLVCLLPFMLIALLLPKGDEPTVYLVSTRVDCVYIIQSTLYGGWFWFWLIARKFNGNQTRAQHLASCSRA
jgi:hypothetical protein